MDTLIADLKQAVRMLVKSPGFTLIAVMALALGIGANTAIFSVVNTVLLKPLPYPESERIMRIGRKFKTGVGYSISIPKFMAWKNNQAFESMAAYDFSGPGMNLGNKDRAEQVKAIHVSQDFFRVFGVSPVFGRTFAPEEDRPGGMRVAVLGYGLWKSRFGGAMSQIGASVVLNGDPYVVIGVLPATFFPDPPADIFLPLQADPNSANQGHYLSVAGKLRPGFTAQQAQAQMKVIFEQFQRANPNGLNGEEGVAVVSAQEVAVGDIKPALLILLGAVGFVLLIACANVANLLLARAAGRQREMAIRSALGAGRWRVIRQLLTESLVLSVVGGVAGFVLSAIGVQALLAFMPPDIPRLSTSDGAVLAIPMMDWGVMSFTLVVALATGLIFGLFPAWQIARTNVNHVLKEASSRSGTGMRQNRLRGALVVAETALALVLLIGAALMVQTFTQLKNVNPGFDAHNLLTMKSSLAGVRYGTTAQVDTLARQVVQRVEALPGVEAASMTMLLPVEGSVDLPFLIPGHPLKKGEQFSGDENWTFVTPHYFDVFKIRLLRGRLFTESDTGTSSKVVIINEAIAKKYWGKEDPIGRQMEIGGKVMGPEFEEPPRQVVGIVSTVRQANLNTPDQGVMYVPQAQVVNGLTVLANKVVPMSWTIRTKVAPLSLGTAVQREIGAVDGQVSVSKIRTMEQVIGEQVSRQSFNMLLLSIFAGIALLLAAIGIYGLMSYTVEQRTQEMGIRMALGAGQGAMIRMVVMQGMRLTLIGVATGLAAAYGLTRLLAKLLFGVQASDAATFAGVAAILTAVALVATYIPARRATRVDPLHALRYE